jgi:hypothetical protein
VARTSNPDTPPVGLDVPIERAELSNGMELAVVSNRMMPVVTALVAFRAGPSSRTPR